MARSPKITAVTSIAGGATILGVDPRRMALIFCLTGGLPARIAAGGSPSVEAFVSLVGAGSTFTLLRRDFGDIVGGEFSDVGFTPGATYNVTEIFR